MDISMNQYVPLTNLNDFNIWRFAEVFALSNRHLLYKGKEIDKLQNSYRSLLKHLEKTGG